MQANKWSAKWSFTHTCWLDGNACLGFVVNLDCASLTMRPLVSRWWILRARRLACETWYTSWVWLNPSIPSLHGTSECRLHRIQLTCPRESSGRRAVMFSTAFLWAIFLSRISFWTSWPQSKLMQQRPLRFALLVLMCHQELSEKRGGVTKVLDGLEQCTVKGDTNRISPPTICLVEKHRERIHVRMCKWNRCLKWCQTGDVRLDLIWFFSK